MASVKVEDFEVFSLFRAALVKFAQAASNSLSNADSQVARTRSWLELDQTSFWNGQLRKRAEMVKIAREALRQKKLYKDASGKTPDSSQEEKDLKKAIAAFEQAEWKLAAIKKSLPKLEKANDLYRGAVSGLSRTVEGEIPKAVALLDRLAASLQEYVEIKNFAGDVTDSSATASESAEPSLARGADSMAVEPVAEPAAEKPSEIPAAAAAEAAAAVEPENQEADHVAHGQ